MRESTREVVTDALAHALLFQGRKRAHDADRFMARMVAERLTENLALSGFVIMKKPPEPMHSTRGHMPERGRDGGA